VGVVELLRLEGRLRLVERQVVPSRVLVVRPLAVWREVPEV